MIEVQISMMLNIQTEQIITSFLLTFLYLVVIEKNINPRLQTVETFHINYYFINSILYVCNYYHIISTKIILYLKFFSFLFRRK